MFIPAAYFSSVWIVLCRVERQHGDPVAPIIIAFLDNEKKTETQIGKPKLQTIKTCPYPTGPKSLIVTIDAQDLVGAHLELGWRLPDCLLDLAVEFRNLSNGKWSPAGNSLVGALAWFGLPAGPAFVADHAPASVRRQLFTIADLFHCMSASMDWQRAFIRGRYQKAVGQIEAVGTPIDARGLAWLSKNWTNVRQELVESIDVSFGYFKGGRFQIEAFENRIAARGITWPRNATGRLDLSDDVFKERARAHPELVPLKELRTTLAGGNPGSLSISRDGRNRTALNPFASRTGRNQPSTKTSIMSGPAWLRYFVRPEPGMGLALIDWSQQEFGIAAALSGDLAMRAAYGAGDPYLSFAFAAGAAHRHATQETHADIRAQFKACALGVQYGMGAGTLARMLNLPHNSAASLLRRHRMLYSTFWRWSDDVEAEALLTGHLQSVFGWQITVEADANPRFLRNFPMQANGAEMLRLACCLVTEAGIRICAPLHDALLIEASLSELDAAVAQTQRLMAEASSIVLDGFELRSNVRTARYPERLGDDRGRTIWPVVESLIEKGCA